MEDGVVCDPRSSILQPRCLMVLGLWAAGRDILGRRLAGAVLAGRGAGLALGQRGAAALGVAAAGVARRGALRGADAVLAAGPVAGVVLARAGRIGPDRRRRRILRRHGSSLSKGSGVRGQGSVVRGRWSKALFSDTSDP